MTDTTLRVLTLFWAVCIATGTIIRSPWFGPRAHVNDSLLQTFGPVHIAVHIAGFTILGALLFLNFETPEGRTLTALLGVVLGFGTESYEHLLSHASMEFRDVLLNALGVLAGAAFSARYWASSIRRSRVTGA